LRSVAEIDALLAEFTDRFGSPPELVRSLLFQLRIKLLAEKAGLMSITTEANQIALRYPEGMMPGSFPDLGEGGHVRVGKYALWMPYTSLPDWQTKLVELVGILASNTAG
jgi:transcription-repair coupling factor (superfamily II helicase)